MLSLESVKPKVVPYLIYIYMRYDNPNQGTKRGVAFIVGD